MSERNKSLLASGQLLSFVVCLYIFLFLELIAEFNINPIAVIIATMVTAIASMFVIPLLYDKINSSVMVATGRYHLPLAISLLLASFFTTVLCTLDPLASSVYLNIMFCISYTISIMSMLVLWYVYTSIRSRVIEPTDKKFFAISDTLKVLMIIFFILLVYIAAISDYKMSFVATFISITILSSGVCVYLASASSIPKFIRIQQPKQRTNKERYKRFYGILTPARNKYMAIVACLIATAIFMFTQYITVLAYIFSINQYLLVVAFVVFVIGFMVAKVHMDKKLESHSIYKIIIILVITSSVVAGACVGFYYINTLFVLQSLIFFLMMFVLGVDCATLLAVCKYQVQDIMANTSSTEGAIHLTYNIILLLAFSVAVCFSQIVTMIGVVPVIIYFSVVVGLCIMASIFTVLWKKASGVPLNMVDFNVTSEILRDIESNEDELSFEELMKQADELEEVDLEQDEKLEQE